MMTARFAFQILLAITTFFLTSRNVANAQPKISKFGEADHGIYHGALHVKFPKDKDSLSIPVMLGAGDVLAINSLVFDRSCPKLISPSGIESLILIDTTAETYTFRVSDAGKYRLMISCIAPSTEDTMEFDESDDDGPSRYGDADIRYSIATPESAVLSDSAIFSDRLEFFVRQLDTRLRAILSGTGALDANDHTGRDVDFKSTALLLSTADALVKDGLTAGDYLIVRNGTFRYQEDLVYSTNELAAQASANIYSVVSKKLGSWRDDSTSLAQSHQFYNDANGATPIVLKSVSVLLSDNVVSLLVE